MKTHAPSATKSGPFDPTNHLAEASKVSLTNGGIVEESKVAAAAAVSGHHELLKSSSKELKDNLAIVEEVKGDTELQENSKSGGGADVEREAPSGKQARRINRYCKKYAKLNMVIEDSEPKSDSWNKVSAKK